MASKKSSDWPPKGWKVQIKHTNARNVKCYIHSKTGRKFYSKLAVLRYIKDQGVGKQGSHTKKGPAKTSSGKKQMHPLGANDSYGLPPGWIIEYRTRKSGPKEGTKYKCFIDPSTGNKFFSKPEVYRYLESVNGSMGSSEQKEDRSIRHSSSNMSVDLPSNEKYDLQSNVSQVSTSEDKRLSSEARKVVVERTVDEELPSGWVKEMRYKMRGNKVVRRDPFYLDPGSGLVFRSKLEALRYVETGEISRHAYRRKNGSIRSEEFVIEKTLPTFSGEKGKTGSGTRKRLFADELSPKESISRLQKAGDRRITRSFARVSPVSVDQAIHKQSALLPESVNMALPIVQDADGKENDLTRKQSEPSTAPSRNMLEGKPEDLALQGCSNGKTQSGKRKTKDGKSPSVPFRSSKRLAGVDAEVVFHPIPIEHARLSKKRKSRENKEAPSLGTIPGESQERTHMLDAEPSNELGSQEQARALDINAQTVLATQEESLNKNDSLNQLKEMAQSKEQASPSFSQYPKSEGLQSSTIPSVEDPANTLPQGKIEIEHTVTEEQPDRPAGSKIENALGDRPILLDQPGNVERDMEFCYPSPLWTDPCLDFAFKTLTGAIPLDDNLAIQDYIQHQLRTSSKQSNNDQSLPDMGVPSFFQSGETKSASSLQDVSFPNSNGVPNIKHVNDN